MVWRLPFGDPGSVRRDFLVLWALVGLAGIGAEVARRHHAPRLTFLQVGQGDCTVYQGDGYVMVVDAAGKTDHFDAGERLAVPAMRRLAVDRIDLLVLTHPDSDHVGGLAALSSHFRIGAVAVPWHFQGNLEMLSTLRAAGIEPGRVHWIRDEQTLHLGRAEVLLWTAPARLAAADNDGSMLTKITLEKGTAVLTGDASSEVEDWLADRPGWDAQVLKAGHHGSKTSTSTKWLTSVRPNWVVFSCGVDNMYGHPSQKALERTQKEAQIWRTDRQGEMTFTLSPSGFVPVSHRTP